MKTRWRIVKVHRFDGPWYILEAFTPNSWKRLSMWMNLEDAEAEAAAVKIPPEVIKEYE